MDGTSVIRAAGDRAVAAGSPAFVKAGIAVARSDGSRPASPLDHSADRVPDRSSAGQPSVLTARGGYGRGVAIGLVDYGFDIFHPALAFRDAAGARRSRFAELWDQNGGCYDRDRLDQWIAAGAGTGGYDIYDPHANYYDATGGRHGAHGTLMASIAAGGAPGRLLSPAPAADLIGVQLALPETAWKEIDAQRRPTWQDWRPHNEPVWRGWRSYCDAEATVRALDYLVEQATARRLPALVINLSLGAAAGAHDGRSPVEQKIAAIAEAGSSGDGGRPVVAVVACVGNAGGRGRHASVAIAPGAEQRLDWTLASAGPMPRKLEVWYDGPATLQFALQSPGNGPATVLASGLTCEISVAGQRIGLADHRCGASGPLHCARFILHPPSIAGTALGGHAPTTTWSIVMRAPDGSGPPCQVHAWLEREDAPGADAWLSPSDTASTLSCLATADGAIVVGGFDAARAPAQPFDPAGRGPHPWCAGSAGRIPHLSAPAHRVCGAQSKSSGYTLTSGTSAAAALVSGALAATFSVVIAEASAAGRDPRPELARLIRRLRATDDRSDKRSWHPALGFATLDGTHTLREVTL